MKNIHNSLPFRNHAIDTISNKNKKHFKINGIVGSVNIDLNKVKGDKIKKDIDISKAFKKNPPIGWPKVNENHPEVIAHNKHAEKTNN